MERISESDIWEIFNPGMKLGELYKFAITTQSGKILYKACLLYTSIIPKYDLRKLDHHSLISLMCLLFCIHPFRQDHFHRNLLLTTPLHYQAVCLVPLPITAPGQGISLSLIHI